MEQRKLERSGRKEVKIEVKERATTQQINEPRPQNTTHRYTTDATSKDVHEILYKPRRSDTLSYRNKDT